MALSIEIESLVNNLVEQLLVKPGGNEKTLHFGFKCEQAHYHSAQYKGRSYYARGGLHLLYHRLPGYGYVNVFSAITSGLDVKIDKVTDWKHESSHDSCWRNIGAFNEVYFGLAQQLNEKLEADGHETVAPMNMTQHNGPQLFGPIFSWVNAKVTIDPADDRRYRKLVEIEK